MTIDELNALATLTAGDEFPVWDSEESGESTKKITAQNMTASVKALGSLVNASEMNNALAGKQNTLTFDTTPTTGSTNPVTSGGVADAIQQSMADVIRTADVVNSLTSTAINKPLSAAQGKALNDAINVSYEEKSLTGANNATGTLRYIQIGKAVYFYAILTSSSAATAVNGLFANLPASLENIEFPATPGHSNNPYPHLQIRPDGGMRNYAQINGTAYCSGVYFTA